MESIRIDNSTDRGGGVEGALVFGLSTRRVKRRRIQLFQIVLEARVALRISIRRFKKLQIEMTFVVFQVRGGDGGSCMFIRRINVSHACRVRVCIVA